MKNKIIINNKEYFKIPGYKKYAISETGEVILLPINKVLKWHKSKPPKVNSKNMKHGYYSMTIVNDDGEIKGVKRHRLLMLTFKPIKNSNELYVNHINGLPGDDRLDNLEWVTPRENLLHAIENGLMPNSIIAVDVKINNKIESFKSIAECAKRLNWSHSKTIHRIKKNTKKYPDNIIIKLKKDKWPKLEDTLVRMGVRRSILAINIDSNLKSYYPTIMHAAKSTGVNTTSISQVAKANNGKTVKRYKFYFTDNYS